MTESLLEWYYLTDCLPVTKDQFDQFLVIIRGSKFPIESKWRGRCFIDIKLENANGGTEELKGVIAWAKWPGQIALDKRFIPIDWLKIASTR